MYGAYPEGCYALIILCVPSMGIGIEDTKLFQRVQVPCTQIRNPKHKATTGVKSGGSMLNELRT